MGVGESVGLKEEEEELGEGKGTEDETVALVVDEVVAVTQGEDPFVNAAVQH